MVERDGAPATGFAIGVDLGTSNTVAVVRWPDGRTRPLLFDGAPVMPSGVVASETGQLIVGRDAQRLAGLDPARYEPNPKRRIDEPTVLLGTSEESRPSTCSPRCSPRWPEPLWRRWVFCPPRF